MGLYRCLWGYMGRRQQQWQEYVNMICTVPSFLSYSFFFDLVHIVTIELGEVIVLFCSLSEPQTLRCWTNNI